MKLLNVARHMPWGAALMLGLIVCGLLGCSGCSQGSSSTPTSAPTSSALPAFPLVASGNAKYLQDQQGVPFPILGRTAWFVLSVPVADYMTFINDTAARGYNAIELMVVTRYSGGNHPPFSGNGKLPFLKQLDGSDWSGSFSYGSSISTAAPDFTTPNPEYWRFVDEFLAYCESRGLLVFLFPAYVGYDNAVPAQGWMEEMVANGQPKMQQYGAWIADRYKNQKNLVWMAGGDSMLFDQNQTNVEAALIAGLKSIPSQQSVFFSAEWTRGSIATDQAPFGSQMTLNGVYTNSLGVNFHGRRAYARSSTMPAYLLEEPFDEEGADGTGFNLDATQPVRRFQWWGWLSTIGGYMSGNGFVWPFIAPWRDHLDTQGSRDMAQLNAFIRSIAWYKLVPSGLGGMTTLITAGGGICDDPLPVNASTCVAAAATLDGTLQVAYVPPDHSGSITINMAVMSGPARARWFDPTNGVYVNAGTRLDNTGTLPFTPPGANSADQSDWVLLLERQ